MTGRILFFLAVFLTLSQAAYATFDAGLKAYNEKDWVRAIYYLRPLAENGDDKAMVILGNMYNQGYGVKKDFKEAFALYRRASLRDNVDAMVMTAAMYQRGIGTPKNGKLATAWFGRAARMGHQVGAFFYALHLYGGNKSDKSDLDVKPDLPQAYKWFRVVSEHAKQPKLKGESKRLAEKVAALIKPEDKQAVDMLIPDWKAETPREIGPSPETIDLPGGKKEEPKPLPQKAAVPAK